MGAVSNFSQIAFDCVVQGREAERFTLVAELREGARESIIGEACYALDSEAKCGEFAISVADRWQSQGLGSALLCAVQARAISLGHFKLFGESNARSLKIELGVDLPKLHAGYMYFLSPTYLQ